MILQWRTHLKLKLDVVICVLHINRKTKIRPDGKLILKICMITNII